MSNSASKRQCQLKRQLKEMSKQSGRNISNERYCSDPTLRGYIKAGNEFCRGPNRYGNQRNAVAKTKVSKRRAKRRQEQLAVKEEIRNRDD